jgi:hypothetical protein
LNRFAYFVQQGKSSSPPVGAIGKVGGLGGDKLAPLQDPDNELALFEYFKSRAIIKGCDRKLKFKFRHSDFKFGIEMMLLSAI